MMTLELAVRHLAILQALLAEHVPTAEVWAYGSRVDGTAHDGSDLDLAICLPDGTPRSALADLRDSLERSMIPVLADVHDWNALPKSFRTEILRTGIRLRPADAGGSSYRP